jgi:isoquinoline 1-oxidoreductase beta subunit
MGPVKTAVSRRGLLGAAGAGALLLALRPGSRALAAVAPGAALDFEPDLFVSIAGDGTVTIVTHRSEMGTGIRTSMPMIVADELGADWDRVTIEQAPGDARYGSQNTDGSRSVRYFFDRMRVAGATARTLLEEAAARRWGVDPAECEGREHAVVHGPSGRRLGFGELVAEAAELPVPAPESLRFRPASEYRYVGKHVSITDLDDIVTGRAGFGIDARLDGQLFAVIAHPPVLGQRPARYDAEAALGVPGVEEVLELATFDGAPGFQPLGGVAVLATNTWAAIRGREALAVEWEGGEAHAGYDSVAYEAELGASAREGGKVWRDDGDAAAVLQAAPPEELLEAEYHVPLLAHAPMEPPCALADVRQGPDGEVTGVRAWAATQNPQAAQQTVAGVLGVPLDMVRVDVTLLGGGFGRKSKPDYVAEAALLSRELGRPVHVTWTREDDLRHDYFHAVGSMHLRARLEEGRVTALRASSAFPTISSTFVPGADLGSAGEMGMGFTDMPYAIPNLRVESGRAKAHVRIGWMRSVANIYHVFAGCSFVDELAHRAGRDPYEFLMELYGEDREVPLEGVEYSNYGQSLRDHPISTARLKHVTRRAAELAGWGRELPRGRGLGIACYRSFNGYAANVVEVEVSRAGEVTIEKAWLVIDAGTIVNPDRVRSQMEGSAVFGASVALHGEVKVRGGIVEPSNFDGYPVARMADGPKQVVVEIVESDALPGGVGETGTPPFAPAVTNAVFAATGKRVRRLPLAAHDLSWS